MPRSCKSSRPAPGERDKRAAQRRAISYPVAIETLDDGGHHPCMILDISETGARLSLFKAMEPPDEFLLRLAGHRVATRLCRVVWRDATAIGVRFVKVEAT